MSRESGGCHTREVRLLARAVGCPTGGRLPDRAKGAGERSEPLSDRMSGAIGDCLAQRAFCTDKMSVGKNVLPHG